VEEFDAAVKENSYENAVEIDETDALSFGKLTDRDIPLLSHFPVSCKQRVLPWNIIPPSWWGISEKTAYLPKDTDIFLYIKFKIYQHTRITIFLYYATLPLDFTLNGKIGFSGKEITLDTGEYIIHSKVSNPGDYRIKTAINLPKENHSIKISAPEFILSCSRGITPKIQTSNLPAAEFPPDAWLISVTSRKDENIHSINEQSQNPKQIYPKSCSGYQMILDFGEEVSGYLSFELVVYTECIIDFYLFEKLLENNKPEHTEGLYNILRYRAKPGGQSYESATPRAGRFLQVTVSGAEEVTFLRLEIINTLYPATPSGNFSSKNPMMDNIWELCRKTSSLCMEDTFTDCPTYERTYWVGDSRIQSLCAYYAFGDYKLQRHCLVLAAYSLERSPFPEGRVPANTISHIPPWAFAWIISVWEYYLHSGDKQLIRQLYPSVKRTIGSFNTLIHENLLWTAGWNFIDWANVDSPSGAAVTAVNAFFIKALEAASNIAASLKKNEQVGKYHSISEQIRREANRRLWDFNRNVYLDCIRPDGTLSSQASEQTQILSFLADICKYNRKKILAEAIALFPADTMDAGIGTPYFMHYLFTALRKMKKINRIRSLIKEYWSPMIQLNSPGCFEVFPGYQEDRMTRSYCHGWSSSPLYHMQVAILGIEPLEPGFLKISVIPSIDLEKKCSGTVPSPLGNIHIEWEVFESSAEIHLSIPLPMQAYITLPVNYKWKCSGALTQVFDSERAVFFVNSGGNFILKGRR
jgi:hypothetical protein